MDNSSTVGSENVTRTRLAYSFSEAAAALSISERFLRYEVKRGKIRPARLATKCMRFEADELKRYLADARVDG
jgi:excisionase family DNA binding protein